MRIGFRPYSVQVSADPTALRNRAVLRKTYFLGVMLRLELELPSGLVIRSRLSKEEFARLGLEDDKEVSFQIRSYRILSKEGDLGNEVATMHTHKPSPYVGEGI